MCAGNTCEPPAGLTLTICPTDRPATTLNADESVVTATALPQRPRGYRRNGPAAEPERLERTPAYVHGDRAELRSISMTDYHLFKVDQEFV